MSLRCACAILAALPPPAPSQGLAFVDESSALGLDVPGFGRGAAWIDLDQDGLYDIVDTSAGEPTLFWRRCADGTFNEVGASWGIAPLVQQTWGVLAADFDADGDADLAFPAGGFGAPEPNRLLRNDLATSGTFSEIGPTAGDFEGAAATFGGAVLDYDRDGDLDIFFSNTRFVGGPATCTLLRNDLELGLGPGSGLTFTDVSTQAGITHLGAFLHSSAGDFDNDGLVDVGVGSMTGPNRLYRNRGDGTFEDVAPMLGLDSPTLNFGFVLEDFDNDGWLDVFLPKYQLDPAGPSELYLNDGTGAFVDVSAASGLTGQTDMGHNTADVDGDGYPDIFIGTGSPGFASDDLLLLIRPVPGGVQATDVARASGLLAAGPTRLHGIVFADDDGDGDLDVFANNGGPPSSAGTIQQNFFWRNQQTGVHWLAVDLLGRVSNRDAIGARVAVLLPSGERVYRRRGVGRGFANTDPPTLHFGLAQETQPVALEIDWPSGVQQVVPLDSADERLAVAELGLLLADPPEPGGELTLVVVGEPGSHVVLGIHVAAAPAGPPSALRQPFGLHAPVGGLCLDSAGTLELTFAVPPASSGSVWTFGATLQAPSGESLAAEPLVVPVP